MELNRIPLGSLICHGANDAAERYFFACQRFRQVVGHQGVAAWALKFALAPHNGVRKSRPGALIGDLSAFVNFNSSCLVGIVGIFYDKMLRKHRYSRRRISRMLWSSRISRLDATIVVSRRITTGRSRYSI